MLAVERLSFGFPGRTVGREVGFGLGDVDLPMTTARVPIPAGRSDSFMRSSFQHSCSVGLDSSQDFGWGCIGNRIFGVPFSRSRKQY